MTSFIPLRRRIPLAILSLIAVLATSVFAAVPFARRAEALVQDSMCKIAGQDVVNDKVDGPLATAQFAGLTTLAVGGVAGAEKFFVGDIANGSSTVRQVDIATQQVSTLDILPRGVADSYISSLAVDRTRNILYGASWDGATYAYVWRWPIGSVGRAVVIAGSATSIVNSIPGGLAQAGIGATVGSLALNNNGTRLFFSPRDSTAGPQLSTGSRIYSLADPFDATADAARTLNLVVGNGLAGVPSDGAASASALVAPVSLSILGNGDLVYRSADSLVRVSPTGGQTILNQRNGNLPESADSTAIPLSTSNLYTQSVLADVSTGGSTAADSFLSYGGDGNRFQKITLAGTAPTVVALSGTGQLGYVDGAAASTQFGINYYPDAAAFGPDGAVYVADHFNRRIRRIDKNSGVTTTVAGIGQSAKLLSGNGLLADVDGVLGITRDRSNGDLYFATSYARIYKMTAAGEITLFAGNGKVTTQPSSGGSATAVELGVTPRIAISPTTRDVFVQSDTLGRMFRITQAGVATPLPLGASQVYGNGVTVDDTGTIYYTTRETGQIRKFNIDAAGAVINQTIVAGGGPQALGTTETAALATDIGNGGSINSVAVDKSGNVFFSATTGIGRYTAATGTVSKILGTYLVGNGQGETAADVYAPDKRAIDTRSYVQQVVVDPYSANSADLYWYDTFGLQSIRPVGNPTTWTSQNYRDAIAQRLNAKNSQNVVVSGNGGPAQLASVTSVQGLAVGPDQEVFFTDSYIPTNGVGIEQIRVIATNGCARLRSTGAIDLQASGTGVKLTDIPSTALPLGLPGYGASDLDSIALNGTTIEGLPLANLPLANLPLANLPLANLPLANLPLANLPLANTPLIDPPGGWTAFFVGTSLQGVPPQNIKFLDLFKPGTDIAAKVTAAKISFKQIDLSNSPLANLSLSSVVLGDTPLANLKLPTANPDAYAGWCEEISKVGFSCADLGITPQSTVFELDVKSVPLANLPLANLPLANLPLANLPLANLPLANLPLANLPLANLPLANLPLANLPLANTPLANLPLANLPLANLAIDCSGNWCVGKTLLDARNANRIKPGATIAGIIDILGAVKVFEFGQSLPSYVTLGDLMLLFVRVSDLPWESVPLERLNLAGIGAPNAQTAKTIGFTFGFDDTRTASDITVTAEFPSGLSYVAGSAVATVNSGVTPPFTQTTVPATATALPKLVLTFASASLPAKGSVLVNFGVRSGSLAVGDTSVNVTVSATGKDFADSSASLKLNVSDPNEPNNDPNAALPALAPDTLVTGAFPAGDPVDYYRVASKGPKGTRNTFYLSHLPQDADIVIYESNQQAPLRGGTFRVGQTAPLETAADPQLRTTGAPIDPQTAQDIGANVAGLRVVGFSAKRGNVNDTVEVVSTGTQNGYIVQVRPYNAKPSTSPYLLRLKQVIPPSAANCIMPAPLTGGGTQGVAPTTIAGKSSLILVNRKRLGDTYGAADVEGATGIMSRLDALAAATNGVVLAVEADANVRSAYDVWNGAPCDVDAANGVVIAINAYVDSLFPPGAAQNQLKSITIVGSDQQIPMGRVADDTKYSNEADYAQDLLAADGKSTPLSAAANLHNTLTDDPYASLAPLSIGQRVLYEPNVAIGRLVETPADMQKSIAAYLTPAPGLTVGEIDPQTSLVTGYDFLIDGATAVNGNLNPRTPTQSVLINDTWTKANLDGAVFPAAGTSPAILAINGHFSHNEALPAAGNTTNDLTDLFTTADVSAAARADKLARRIILSMGCHAGINVPDVYVGDLSSRKLDWAQAFSQQGAVYIANSGYGYGDTDGPFYSEDLQARIATKLRNGSSIADALRAAKVDYRKGKELSTYDMKVLMQTVYYGIPNVRLSGTFVPEVIPPSSALGTDPKTGLEASEFDVNAPSTQVAGPYYVVGGQAPMVIDGRPVQPRTDLEVTQTGRVAHGALITALTSNDVANFPVKFSRPMVDLAANEQPTFAQNTAFPSFLQNVTSYTTRNATGSNIDRQQLVLAAGQWFSTSTTNPRIGTQRLFTNLKGRVFYRAPGDTDFTPPAISSTTTSNAAGAVTFTVKASDANPIKRVLVLYLDGGTWRSLDLAANAAGDYEGATPTTAATLDYFVQVVDASGNVGVSSNKAALFNATGTGGAGGTPVVVVEPPIVPIPNSVPVVSAITTSVSSAGGSTTVTATGSFADADSTAWTGSINWGDGSAASPLTLNADKTFSATKTFTVTGTFNYTGTVTITDDRAGVGTKPFDYAVTVAATNIAPVIATPVVSFAQSAGNVNVTVSGTFTDADSSAWTGTILWSTGNSEPLTINTVSGLSFTATKGYAAAASLSAVVTITDNKGGSTSVTVPITVPAPNVAPVVTAAVVTAAVSGSVINLTLNGSFTDADSTTWIGSVDWADGTGSKPLTINAATKTLRAQTSSFTSGTRTGTVTVCDSANACGTKTFTYTVTAPPRAKLTPYVDCFTENRNASNQIVSLTVKFGYNNPNPYPVTIPLGSLNSFVPTPVNRGQPTVFSAGRQTRAFSVTMGANSAAAWILDGRLVNFSKTFSKC
jgi:uncharacterized protein YjbI with pentapeptide repeats